MRSKWLLMTVLLGCAAPSSNLKPGSQARPAAAPFSRISMGVFQELVAEVRRHHVFAEQTFENLGRTWDEDLPRLEKEFRQASTKSELVAAINHLVNSLHNPHCFYNTPDRPIPMTAGFEIEVEWRAGSPSFYVSRVDEPALRGRIAPGDYLVSADGVPSQDFLQAFIFESNGNNWRSIASDIASFLCRRTTQRTTVKPGDQSRWVFRTRDGSRQIAIQTRWKAVEQRRQSDFLLDYRKNRCDELAPESYGPYRLQARGSNYCLYAGERQPYDRYPIVRFFSFDYYGSPSFHGLKTDFFNLKQQLAGIETARGVILDLRENRGGNNPNWFLAWWAPAPYSDHFVYFKLHPDLDSRAELQRARITGWGPTDISAYLEALAARKPDQAFWGPRPFFCPTPDCRGWDNRYRPSERVTELPVALLVGPRCISSCDHFAFIFKENGFGPLIGLPGAAGYTGYRMMHRLRSPHLDDLGFCWLAFSYEVSGKTRKAVEAVPVAPDHLVERSFENSAVYSKLLVDTAIESFDEHAYREGGSR
ncbi:MAG: hypothetical protein JXR96_17295 [Deltaproteobacteria bacterium]|nr:hypothetical protein [Deltaproteobacteria bacterium]